MAKLNPYLTFNGNCEEAFNFYKSIFGGEFNYIGRFADMPPQEGFKVPETHLDQIMHISLPISNESTLMGSDTGGDWSNKLETGNNISLSLSLDSKAEADSIFKSLSRDGVIIMPMELTFWGDYFGMCTDKFEVNWMISFNEGHPLK